MKWLEKLKAVVRPVKSRDSPIPDADGETWPEPLSLLTLREREVFDLLLRTRKVKDASTELGIKYPTLRSHCKSIYKKLKVNSHAELVHRYGS